MTAAGEEALGVPTRLLSWQTGKRLRIVDPDGRVVREIEPGAESRSVESSVT